MYPHNLNIYHLFNFIIFKDTRHFSTLHYLIDYLCVCHLKGGMTALKGGKDSTERVGGGERFPLFSPPLDKTPQAIS